MAQYNAIDILNKIREQSDEKIKELASQVCLKIIKDIDDPVMMADQDFTTELQGLMTEYSPSKQLATL